MNIGKLYEVLHQLVVDGDIVSFSNHDDHIHVTLDSHIGDLVLGYDVENAVVKNLILILEHFFYSLPECEYYGDTRFNTQPPRAFELLDKKDYKEVVLGLINTLDIGRTLPFDSDIVELWYKLKGE